MQKIKKKLNLHVLRLKGKYLSAYLNNFLFLKRYIYFNLNIHVYKKRSGDTFQSVRYIFKSHAEREKKRFEN